MEEAIRDSAELDLFTQFCRLSRDDDALVAWMWIRVIKHMPAGELRAAQIKKLWQKYFSPPENQEDVRESDCHLSLETPESLEVWGDHVESQLDLVAALLNVRLQLCWLEYKSSPRPERKEKRKAKKKNGSPKERRKLKSEGISSEGEVAFAYSNLPCLARRASLKDLF